MIISRLHEKENTRKARYQKIYIAALARYIQFTPHTVSGKSYQSIRIHLHARRQTLACPKSRSHLRRSYRPNRIGPRISITSELVLETEKFPDEILTSIINLPGRPNRRCTPVITRQDTLVASSVNRFNQPIVSRHQIKKGLRSFRPRITNLLTGNTILPHSKRDQMII